MRQSYKVIVALVVSLCAAKASADSLVYVVNIAQQFGTVNLGNGGFQPIGPGLSTDFAGSSGLVQGTGGSLLTLSASGDLLAVDPVTGTSSLIGSTGLGNNANNFTRVGANLYATDFNNQLYKVDPATGNATPVGSGTGIPTDPNEDFTTNPDGSTNLDDEALFSAGGKLYASFDAFAIGADGYSTTVQVPPALWEIDTTTGLASEVASTSLHLLSFFSDNGDLYAFQGNPNPTSPFPSPEVELVTYSVSNGQSTFVRDVDPQAGTIFGATAVTPEPNSLVLLGTGIVALATNLRTRRRVNNR